MIVKRKSPIREEFFIAQAHAKKGTDEMPVPHEFKKSPYLQRSLPLSFWMSPLQRLKLFNEVFLNLPFFFWQLARRVLPATVMFWQVWV